MQNIFLDSCPSVSAAGHRRRLCKPHPPLTPPTIACILSAPSPLSHLLSPCQSGRNPSSLALFLSQPLSSPTPLHPFTHRLSLYHQTSALRPHPLVLFTPRHFSWPPLWSLPSKQIDLCRPVSAPACVPPAYPILVFRNPPIPSLSVCHYRHCLGISLQAALLLSDALSFVLHIKYIKCCSPSQKILSVTRTSLPPLFQLISFYFVLTIFMTVGFGTLIPAEIHPPSSTFSHCYWHTDSL